MADEDLGTGSVTIELDDTNAIADARRLQSRLERALDDAGRAAGIRAARAIQRAIDRVSPQDIEVRADMRRFEAAINNVNNLGSTELRVDPSVDADSFRREVQQRLQGVSVTIEVRPDLDGFDTAIRAHRMPEIDVRVNADRSQVAALSKALGSLGNVAKSLLAAGGTITAIGGIGIAAAGATAAVGAFVAALAPAAGIVAAFPAAALGAAASINALKLATLGVGDAFSAALLKDAEKFEKTLEGLPPAAQAAAREVRSLRPAFDALREAVAGEFFGRFKGDIAATATALQGPLTNGLKGIAREWGNAVNGALDYVKSTQGVTNVTTILEASRKVTAGFAKSTDNLTAGFLKIGDAVSNAFGDRASKAIESAGTRLGDFLAKSAESGAATQWVENAIAVFKQLGAILKNVGGIIKDVFAAGNAVGGGFLNNLQTITGEIRKFTSSVEGQEALGNLFSGIAAAARQLGPIFSALATQIGNIAPAFIPIFDAVGPVIVNALNAIGPAIARLMPFIQTFITALGDGLNEIAASGVLNKLVDAFGAFVTSLSPAIPAIAQIITALASGLAPAIEIIGIALGPVIRELAGALVPIMPLLADAVIQVVDALAPFIASLGVIGGQLLKALAPLLLTVAQIFGRVAEALAPLIVQLVNGLMPIFEQLAPVINSVVQALIPFIEELIAQLLPVLPPIVDAFLALVNAITPLFPLFAQILVALTPLLTMVLKIVGPILQFAAGIGSWVIINVVVPLIVRITDTLVKMTQKTVEVINAIVKFARDTKKWFTDAYNNTVQTVAKWIVAIERLWNELPGKVGAALANLGNRILARINEAKTSATNGARNLVNDFVNMIRELPGKAVSALGNLGSLLVNAGRSLIRGLINGVNSAVGALRSRLAEITNLLPDWKGPADKDATILNRSGRLVMQGFMDGISSQIPALARQLRGVTVSMPSLAAGGAAAGLTGVSRGIGAEAVATSRQTGTQGFRSQGAQVTNTFNIYEVGDGEVTARRVLNRMILAAGV